jgi:hypothetical protein
MGNMSQTQGPMNQNSGQSHSQSPQNPYQNNQMSSNEANFKKNRSSAQNTPVNSTNTIGPIGSQQIPQQQNISPTQQGNYMQISQPPIISAPQNPNMPTSPSNKISEEHKSILEGVKLAMEIIDSRIPNFSGYAHLILTKNVANL